MRKALVGLVIASLTLLGCGRTLDGSGVASGDAAAGDAADDGGGATAKLPSAACLASGTPGVITCGKASCSGSTPVCCDGVSCLAKDQPCENVDPPFSFADECDDAADCPSGQICIAFTDPFNTVRVCGEPDLLGEEEPMTDASQVCVQTCECVSGTCKNAFCG